MLIDEYQHMPALLDAILVSVEIKAASAARPADAVGLRVLRKHAGDAFLGGVFLYLGEQSCRLDDKIWAVPLDRLWYA